MAKKKTKKEIVKEFTNFAVNSDWDDLAYSIILIEHLLEFEEENPKMLKLLTLKLEICEKEKARRVEKTFDMTWFLSKEFPYLDEEDLDFSDT